MNWWEREPNKTEEEQELDAAMKAYENRFGERYAFQVGFGEGSIKDTIEEINRLIQTGEKQRLNDYKEGLLY